MSKHTFTKKEYNSNDGMVTSIWGPAMWHTLHTISFNYPVNPTTQDKNNYMKFFKSIGNILPCKYCRDNFKKNLETIKLTKETMKNRQSVSKWVYNLHNHINKMTGKSHYKTYEDIRETYENFRSRCTSISTKTNIKEKGCTDSLYGIKSKCILNIVPKQSKKQTFKIDPKCKVKRLTLKKS